MPKVYNKRDKFIPAGAVYVGRPTAYGNPFSHLEKMKGGDIIEVSTREEAVAKFKEWINAPAQLTLRKAIRRELTGKDLVCWCAPKACHADVLIEIANNALADDEE